MLQNEPVEEGSMDATDNEKVAGVIEQTKADVEIGSITQADYDGVLAQRLAEAGLDAPAE